MWMDAKVVIDYQEMMSESPEKFVLFISVVLLCLAILQNFRNIVNGLLELGGRK